MRPWSRRRQLHSLGSNDIDALVETLAPNESLVSPLSGHMVFRGRDELRVLLGAVYECHRPAWLEEIGPGATRAAAVTAVSQGCDWVMR